MSCDTSAFINSGEISTTYASVPEHLPVGYVINSQCDGGSTERFDLGTTDEVIKCTARGRVGILNQQPSGCHCMSFSILNADVSDLTHSIFVYFSTALQRKTEKPILFTLVLMLNVVEKSGY